jgi:hypothetical protein
MLLMILIGSIPLQTHMAMLGSMVVVVISAPALVVPTLAQISILFFLWWIFIKAASKLKHLEGHGESKTPYSSQ